MSSNEELNRYSIALRDFEKAQKYLRAAKKHDFSSIEYEALLFAAIVSYYRPFSKNEISQSPKKNKIPKPPKAKSSLDITDFFGCLNDSQSDYVQQEWTNSNQATSQATATNGSAVVTISSGTWPTNSANAWISFDGGTTWYDVSARDSGTQLTLASNFTGTTGAYNWTMRMIELHEKCKNLRNKALAHSEFELNPTKFNPERGVFHGRSFSLLNEKIDLEVFDSILTRFINLCHNVRANHF